MTKPRPGKQQMKKNYRATPDGWIGASPRVALGSAQLQQIPGQIRTSTRASTCSGRSDWVIDPSLNYSTRSNWDINTSLDKNPRSVRLGHLHKPPQTLPYRIGMSIRATTHPLTHFCFFIFWKREKREKRKEERKKKLPCRSHPKEVEPPCRKCIVSTSGRICHKSTTTPTQEGLGFHSHYPQHGGMVNHTERMPPKFTPVNLQIAYNKVFGLLEK